MVKIIGPLASHHASGRISAPRIYSSSLRNRHDRVAPPAPPPPTGGSLLFGMNTNHCDAPSINHSNQYPGTIEAWIRPSTLDGHITGTYNNALMCGVNLYFYFPFLHVYAGYNNEWHQTLTGYSPAWNVWAHIAVTWEIGSLKLWLDGTQQGTDNMYAYTPSHTSGYRIGGIWSPTGKKFQGCTTRHRFSDIIRYTANFTPATDFTSDANTIALWRMTEAAGTTVADESGNGHTLNFPAVMPPTWSTLTP